MSFDQATHSYEWRVRGTISTLPTGSFRLEMDEAAPAHMISWSNIASVILAELNEDRRTVGAGSADRRVRARDEWKPPGTTARRAGKTPGFRWSARRAAVGGGSEPLNVFYRDTSNRLMRAVVGANGWTSTSMGGVVITDPVAASTGPRADSTSWRSGSTTRRTTWSWNGSSVSTEHVSATAWSWSARAARRSRADRHLRQRVRPRDPPRRKTGSGVVEDLVGGDASDFPTAVAIPAIAGTTRQVFVRGVDNRIWSASSFNDGPWQWDALAPTGMTDRFAGSPAASMSGSTVIVDARTRSGTLGRLRYTRATGWTYANVGGSIADSPTSLGDAAYAHGQDGTLHFFDGTSWHSEGGRFD